MYDGLGSERTVTGSTGSVTGSLTLSAFGQTVASSGGSSSSYQWGATSGYRSDGDAGLVKVGCRYYDPQVGRFTSRDTVLTQKAYVYCEGDPVNALDPTGHSGFGYYCGFLAVVLTVIVVVVFFPVTGAVFLGGPIGIILIAGVAAIGGYLGDTFGDMIDEANKQQAEYNKAMSKQVAQ